MILCLLPAADYDPTESAVPWAALQQAGIAVRFATPEGKPAHADPRLVSTGFGPLNPLFMTKKADLELYRTMTASPDFQRPLAYADVVPEEFDGLMVPGGHAAGMRTLLESQRARDIVLHFFQTNKPVASVCHGVLLFARTIDPTTGRSVLYGRKTTGLTAVNMELPAWIITKPWLGDYYRTYPQTVEAEVKAALASPADFQRGPLFARRDSAEDLSPGFTVCDGNYLSARWPGDCHRYAVELVQLIRGDQQAS